MKGSEKIMKKNFKCPNCNKVSSGYPAISRTDNKTEICSSCGQAQALSDFFNNPDNLKDHVFCRGCYLKLLKEDKDLWERYDAYGIATGIWCDSCYADDGIYTYKRDNYYDRDNAGENLEPEE